jgi:hypothetical protein
MQEREQELERIAAVASSELDILLRGVGVFDDEQYDRDLSEKYHCFRGITEFFRSRVVSEQDKLRFAELLSAGGRHGEIKEFAERLFNAGREYWKLRTLAFFFCSCLFFVVVAFIAWGLSEAGHYIIAYYFAVIASFVVFAIFLLVYTTAGIFDDTQSLCYRRLRPIAKFDSSRERSMLDDAQARIVITLDVVDEDIRQQRVVEDESDNPIEIIVDSEID